MRTGMLLSSIGFGAAVGITAVSMVMKDSDVIFLAALGVVTFFIGLGFILNGVFLTVPRTAMPDKSSDADRQRELDEIRAPTSDLALPESSNLFSSVTEHTTRHLEKDPIPRDRNVK